MLSCISVLSLLMISRWCFRFKSSFIYVSVFFLRDFCSVYVTVGGHLSSLSLYLCLSLSFSLTSFPSTSLSLQSGSILSREAIRIFHVFWVVSAVKLFRKSRSFSVTLSGINIHNGAGFLLLHEESQMNTESCHYNTVCS